MMDKRYRFENNPELCIQCHACETACRTWNKVEIPLTFRKVVAYEEGNFPFLHIIYRSQSCRHCDQPGCIKVCPADAIAKMENGSVVVDRSKCIGCMACKEACSYNIPQFGSDGRMQKCNMCHETEFEDQKFPCARMCPTGALRVIVE